MHPTFCGYVCDLYLSSPCLSCCCVHIFVDMDARLHKIYWNIVVTLKVLSYFLINIYCKLSIIKFMCSHRDSIVVFNVPFNNDCWNFWPCHLRVNLWTLQFMFPAYNGQSSLILFITDISFSIYSAFTCLTMVIERH